MYPHLHLEHLGKRDKQSGALTFADRHNVPFDWDEEYEHCPLIADNAIEPKPATLPFPDIPAEMPGILYESEMPKSTLLPDEPAATARDPEAAEAAEAAAAIDNANLGPREANLLHGAEIAGVNNDVPQPIYQNITNSNINVVHAEDDKIAPAEEDDNKPPALGKYEDSSDEEDNNYEQNEEEESSESEDDESHGVETVPEEEALEDEPNHNCRSGRERRAPDRLGEWSMLTAASLLTANNGEDTIFVKDDEVA